MDRLTEIEQRTGFVVPKLYRRLRDDGACEYGATPEEWQATWRERALNNPPVLLGALDFEWMTLTDMAEWRAPDYWLPEHVFVPFGESNGDVYAWYPAWRAGDDVPIVRAFHDVSTCEVLAPNLEAFLYRQMLEAMTFPDPQRNEDDGFTEQEAQQAMRASVGALRPYLRAAWFADLDELTKRTPRAWRRKIGRFEEEYVSQLEGQELEERIARELAFPRLNAEFSHMMP